jgi:hypothetical protein
VSIEVHIGFRQFLHQVGRQLADEIFGWNFGQQDDKFVAAQTRHQVVVADRRLEPAGNRLQQQIADRMAEIVIDQLEAVEIEEQQRVQIPAAPGAFELGGSQLLELAAVGNAGQVIVRGQGECADLLLLQQVDQFLFLLFGIRNGLMQAMLMPQAEHDNQDHQDDHRREHQRAHQIFLVLRRQPAQYHGGTLRDRDLDRVVGKTVYRGQIAKIGGTAGESEGVHVNGQPGVRTWQARVDRQGAFAQHGQWQAIRMKQFDAAALAQLDLAVTGQDVSQVENGAVVAGVALVAERHQNRQAPGAIAVDRRVANQDVRWIALRAFAQRLIEQRLQFCFGALMG